VGYRPFEARRRVYIIDPADELTTEAQDALLKTLEEPPASAILILVTAYPDTLLPTIQSRCRRLRFGPLAEHDVARVLTNRGVDPARARLLAAASGGSVGRALAEEAGSLTEDREAAMALIVAAATRGSVAARLKAATALAQHGSKRRDREAVAARLATVASLVRDLTAIDAGAPDEVVNADLIGSLHEAARGFDAGRLSSAFGAVSQAQAALDRNASPKIVADWVALTI
jgi:DNA polymerase-3 subunit delta'